MPDPADPSATLEAIKAQWAQVDFITFKPEVVPDTGPAWQWRDELARVLAALEAVLKAHRPSTADGRCCWCRDADGQRSAWPCGEYLTITRALKGDTDA